MELIEYGPDDGDAIAIDVTLDRAISAADSPWERPATAARRLAEIQYGEDGEPGRHFLVRDDGVDVGRAAVHASEHDNPELAWLWVGIRPDLRSRGIGRQALALTMQICREAGRPSALLYGWDSEPTRRTAAGAGFALRSTEIRRVLALTGSGAERDRFAALHAEAATAAGEYELIRINGAAPDHLLTSLVRVTAAINDAPWDDLDVEDVHVDEGRIRSYEAAQLRSGHRLRRVVARHRRNGEIAGHSVVAVDGELPAWAEQHDTAVVPEHRGHRLGLLLKTEMLLWLHDDEPQLRTILTENMESNGPMVAVNERLGHRIAGRQLLFQRRLGD